MKYVAYFNLACDRYGKEKYKIEWPPAANNEEAVKHESQILRLAIF